MKTKVMYISNKWFNVRMNERMNVIIATLVNAVIPAEEWNRLHDKICNDGKIADDTVVYFDYLMINGKTDRFSFVVVGDWRKLGFSGNNIKNCIPSAPEEVIEEGNRFFYYKTEGRLDLLDKGTLCGKTLESVKHMILLQIHTTEFKTIATETIKRFKEVGMSDEDINKFFDRIIHEVFHPKA